TERHPHLIAVTMSDFGSSGPHADYAGSDMIAVAAGGMLYRAGAPEKPPVTVPGSLGYDTLAVSAAVGVALAYWYRRRTRKGCTIDVSAQEAVANLADWGVPIYSTLGIYQHREGAGSYPIYRCKDGWIRMLIFSKRQWHAVLDWIGRPQELLDPLFEEYFGRYANRPLIDRYLSEFFAGWNMIEAATEAQRRGLAATPLLRPAEAIDNPHTRARSSFVPMEILPGVRPRVPAGFYTIDGERVGPRGRAPLAGEHQQLELRPALREPAQPTNAAGHQAKPPLADLFVVDLGTGVAGPEVGRLLADFGAEVVKVESKTAPDFVRTVIPGDINAPYTSSNRGKQSLGVNLKTERGAALARRLVAQADVLIENSAVGVLERLGLEIARLRADNPRLIVFSTRLLGSSGPWCKWIGYGPNAHAVSGLQYLWNYPEDAERPAGSTNIHPDHYVGRLGALAVLAALVRRERTGRGMHIDVAQFEVLQQLIGDVLAAETLVGGSARPAGNDSPLGYPWGVYPCAGDDEWCVINVATDEQWAALCRHIGRPEWAAVRGAAARRKRREEIDAAIAEWTGSQEPLEVMRVLQDAGVPAAAVEHPALQLADPHLKARGFFRTIEQPRLGSVCVEGPCFRAEGHEPTDDRPAPLLGQHTRSICRRRLGLSDGEIEELLAAGVLEETQVP
ncbi:MAG: CoA transferase, partial [Candidatus Dadabacteria bacterium]